MLMHVPQLHELVGRAANWNLAQLRVHGAESADRPVRIAVNVEPLPTPARWLLTATVIDMQLRLDPLVSEVVVETSGAEGRMRWSTTPSASTHAPKAPIWIIDAAHRTRPLNRSASTTMIILVTTPSTKTPAKPSPPASQRTCR
jgi:hypothetical protein